MLSEGGVGPVRSAAGSFDVARVGPKPQFIRRLLANDQLLSTFNLLVCY